MFSHLKKNRTNPSYYTLKSFTLAAILFGSTIVVLLATSCSNPEASDRIKIPNEESGAQTPESSPFSMIALGDSISTASGLIPSNPLDTTSELFKFPAFSWGTGTNELITAFGVQGAVNGHYARLQNIFPNVQQMNLAVPGQTISELLTLVTSTEIPAIDYVTVSIGGNDICAGTEQDGSINVNRFLNDRLPQIESNLSTIVEHLLLKNPETKFLFLPIPSLEKLVQIGLDPNSAGADPIQPLVPASTCQERWILSDLCQSVLGTRSNSERSAAYNAAELINEALLALVTKFPDNVKLAGSIAELEFEEQHVSRLDCYHPSIEGQNLLAEIAWQEGWFIQ